MLSFHTLGMFALSPVTGWWIDRSGPRQAMLAGLVVLGVSALVVAVPTEASFTPALFFLGVGWNLCYLGGSAHIRQTVRGSQAARAKLESRVEAWVWAVSAVATAGSTALFAEGGFLLLSAVSAILALPLLFVTSRTPKVVAVTATAPGVGD
jgi:MFS family permease